MCRLLLITAFITPLLVRAQSLNPMGPLKGFSTVVRYDAGIKTADCSGALAVGRNASFDGRVNIASQGSVPSFASPEPMSLGLFIGGELRFKYAADVRVHGKNAVKIKNLGEHEVHTRNGKNTQIGSAGLEAGPRMKLDLVQSPASVQREVDFSFDNTFEQLIQISHVLAAEKTQVSLAGEGLSQRLSLGNNCVNYWNVSFESLQKIRTLQFDRAPSIVSPLIINVFGNKQDEVWKAPVFEGLTAGSALFILYNFVDIPSLSIKIEQGLPGSILAPGSTLTLAGPGKLEGQLACKGLYLQDVRITDRPFLSLIQAENKSEERAFTSISAALPETTISLFPNPCTVTLNVQSTSQHLAKALIFNAYGQLLQESSLEAGSISVRQLAAGHYYLQLTDDAGNQVATLPFQKNE